MRLEFKKRAFEDLQYWVTTNGRMAKRVMKLIKDTQREPFGGIGKPEPLKNELAGWWSKRIDGEHRLVYCVKGDCLTIAQAKGHYDD